MLSQEDVFICRMILRMVNRSQHLKVIPPLPFRLIGADNVMKAVSGVDDKLRVRH